MNGDLCGFEVGEHVWSDGLYGRVVRPAREPGVLIVAFSTSAGRWVEMLAPAIHIKSISRPDYVYRPGGPK